MQKIVQNITKLSLAAPEISRLLGVLFFGMFFLMLPGVTSLGSEADWVGGNSIATAIVQSHEYNDEMRSTAPKLTAGFVSESATAARLNVGQMIQTLLQGGHQQRLQTQRIQILLLQLCLWALLFGFAAQTVRYRLDAVRVPLLEVLRNTLSVRAGPRF